ncbi:hypothetical protein ABZ837_03030 [Streptomyces sp. NPDC047197]|uniref:hypothetical protein n=1 Tax=Streptomyces sp. NPDC047197 TaxID=3155477 RepID=UPI003410E93A
MRDGQFVLKISINNPPAYCTDVAGTRANDDNAQSMRCSDTPGQKFVIQGGVIKVEDTV